MYDKCVGGRAVESGDFTYVRLRYSTNFLLIPTLKFKHFLTPISTDMTSLLRKSIKEPQRFCERSQLRFCTVVVTISNLYVEHMP